MPFYAVARGLTPGIYDSWPDCQAQIVGYDGARYKKFSTMDEAKEYVKEHAAFNPLVDRRATKEEKTSDETNDDAPVSCTEKRKHSSDGDNDNDEDADGGSDKKKLAKDDKFSTDSDGFLIVYSDGACQFNGKNGQQAGVGVFFGHDHPLNLSEPVRGGGITNNMAEFQAATRALELVQSSGYTKVAIHSDSQHLINCMTNWVKGWKKKNWVKSDGEPVKNKEELIALDKACDGLAVKWVHVRSNDEAHKGNKEADKLAKQGSKLYKAPEEN